MKKQNRRFRRALRFVVTTAALIALPACSSSKQDVETIPSNRTDQLRARYQDLASGRFAVVADFEETDQLELFHFETTARSGESLTPSEGGVRQTGGRCLSVDFDSPRTVLVANNRDAEDWLLKRDWRAYTLLLMNVYSPKSGVILDVELIGGRPSRTENTRSRWPLRQGWNELRLDLSEVGQFVPLDAMREIHWSLPEIDAPVTLRFDDLLLADNRALVFGNNEGTDGSLYIQREGRRINVGAAGRFELGFVNGQVARWYALESDPLRRSDLLGPGNALGPMPVRLPAGGAWGSDADWRWPLGDAAREGRIATHQRVVEANPLRVIVECTWLKPSASSGVTADRLAQWLYVIYPSGQIYVTLRGRDLEPSASQGDLGLAVSRRPMRGMEPRMHEPGRLGDHPELAARSFGCLATEGHDADLYFMLHDAKCGPKVRAVRGSDAPRVSVVAYGDDGCDVANRTVLLAVWPRDCCDASVNTALARAYGAKFPIELPAGEWDDATAGDENRDGFNERFGTFMLRPDAGRVVLRLLGEASPIRSPVFCVAMKAGEEAWVYIDNKLYHDVASDAQGRLMFQVPGTVGSDTLIEVYLRDRG